MNHLCNLIGMDAFFSNLQDNRQKQSAFILKISAVFTFILMLSSCSILGHEQEFFDGTEHIELELPVWPPVQENCTYPELDFWLVEYETADDSGTLTANASSKSVGFDVPENSSAAFQVYPITKCTGGSILFFKSAGCVYPQNKTAFLWNQGFAANLLYSLYKATGDRKRTAEFASVFNWKKLITTLEQKAINSVREINTAVESGAEIAEYPGYYNPWQLDKQPVLKSIATEYFNSYKLRFPKFLTIDGSADILESIGGMKQLLSPYIPENEVFQKLDFLTIIERTENCSQFLYGDRIASIMVTEDGNTELALCTIPFYKRE